VLQISDTSLASWLDATSRSLLRAGPSVPDMLDRATLIRGRLHSLPEILAGDESRADVLFALCAVFDDEFPCPEPESLLQEVTSAFQVVAGLSWSDDEFDERSHILSRLAFTAWRLCLVSRSYAELKVWRDRCADFVLALDAVPDFTAIGFAHGSSEVNWRFLSDPTILLATTVMFERKRNSECTEVATNAVAACDWLRARLDDASAVEAWFLVGELCVSSAVALKHLGRLDDSAAWLMDARTCYGKLPKPAIHFARSDVVELALLNERHDFHPILSRIQDLKRIFFDDGAWFEYEATRLLEANALKGANRLPEAIEVLSAMVNGDAATTNPTSHCLAAINLAEMRMAEGSYDEASRCFASAATAVAKVNVPLCTAQFYGSFAECLRDQGLIPEAIGAYTASIFAFESAAMRRNAAYIRVLLAETLFAVGRDQEAVAEIATALPTIREARLFKEAIAVTRMLTDAVRRRTGDRPALIQLHEQLKALRLDNND